MIRGGEAFKNVRQIQAIYLFMEAVDNIVRREIFFYY